MINPDVFLIHFSKGNTTFGDAQILHKFAENRSLKVEIGTAYGIGAMILSIHGGTVYTIDNHTFYSDYKKPKIKHKIIKDYLDFFTSGRIKSIIQDSVKASESFDDETIELLYIDGGHSYKQVKADFEAWFPKVKTDAVIIFHDVCFDCPGVNRFYKRYLKKLKTIRELVQKSEFETSIKVFVKG